MICVLSNSELSGFSRHYVEEKLKRAGVHPDDVLFVHTTDALVLNAYPLNVIVTLDEGPLTRLTGLRSLSKYHLSPLDALPEYSCRKVIPTFSPAQQQRQYELGLYMELTFRRAREENASHEYARKPKRFRLNPPAHETAAVLRELSTEPHLSVDIETGRGQINTVGFAWSASDAIAINVLPEEHTPESYYELWAGIAALLEGPSRKICQNGIYEFLYFARYGIRMSGLWHDTMVAQKFLYPELDKGLDNVGRLYTREVYWKDDGKVVSAEGGKKDWGNIRDWDRHYRYNCSDTTGTYEAAFAQAADLSARGLSSVYYDYVMKLHEPLSEMCLRGLPLLADRQVALVAEYEKKSADLIAGLSKPINVRSSKQKLGLFRDKGYALPKKKRTSGKNAGAYGESADELALKKLRLKYPEDDDIRILLEVLKVEKALSSYLRVVPDPLDLKIRYSLDLSGTETGRWAGYKDPWDRGFNPQTMPKYVKKMIGWPA